MAGKPEEIVVYGLEVDEQSVQQTVRGMAKGEASVDSFTDGLERISPITRKVTDDLLKGIEKLGGSTDELRKIDDEFERLEESVIAYWQALEKAKKKQDDLGGKPLSAQDRFDEVSKSVALAGDTQSNLGALRGVADLAGLGGVGSGLGIAGEVVALAEELPRLKVAISGLPDVAKAAISAIGVGGLGLIGVLGLGAVAIKAVTDAEAKRGEAAKKAAAQILSVAEQVASGTTSDDIRAQNSALERQREVLQEGRAALLEYQERIRLVNDSYERGFTRTDQYIQALEGINADLNEFTGGALGVKDGVGEAVSQIGDFNAVLKDNRDDINAVNTSLAANNAALNSQGVAANDAAAAEEALRQAREESAAQLIALFEDEARLRLDLAQLRRSGTSEQIEERLQASQEEQAILQNFLIPSIESMGLTTEAAQQKMAEYTGRIEELRHQDDLLVQAVLPVIEAREREAARLESIDTQHENYLEALKQEEAIRDKITALRREEEQAALESAAAIKKIRDDAAAASDAAETEYREGREKVEEKDRKDREKELQNHLKNLRRINEQFQADSLTAIANRDSAAFDQAKVKAEADEKAERESYKERQEQLDDALRDQYRALDDKLKKEQARIEAAARQAIATEDARYAAEQRQRQQAYQRLENDLVNTLINQMNIAKNGSGGILQIELDHWNLLNNLTAQGVALIQAQWRNLFALPTGGSSLGNGSVPGFGSFDAGGYNLLPGVYESKVPEVHIPIADINRFVEGDMRLPASVARYAPGSTSNTIIDNTTQVQVTYKIDRGMSLTEIRNTVWETLDEAIEAVRKRSA